MTFVWLIVAGLSLYLGFCLLNVLGQMADAMRAMASAIQNLGEFDDAGG